MHFTSKICAWQTHYKISFFKQVPFHEYILASHAFSLQVLGYGLQQISDRWADGKGPLAMYFSSEEVKRLVMAMFENTTKRDIVLKQLRRPSVANLTDI